MATEHNAPVRRRRWVAVLAAALVAATGAFVGLHYLLRNVEEQAPSCSVGSGTAALFLAPDQAAD
ncbi:MAG: hypothetical protein QOJ03_671, partial [Frankiaceae bacterium]|nr:hypothetical protein [Frankiaceae bacterium]